MGRVKISSSSLNVSGSAYINISSPQIINGWWTDMQDNKIYKSLLADVVRFHIETIGISDEKKVKVTIMDYDGVFNPDDVIHKGEIVIKHNKGFYEFKLERSWLKNINDDSGDAIELYARCEYLDYNVSLPQSSLDYLNVFGVGYIVHDDCRVRIRNNGDVEFWPEHFGYLARGQWDNANFPYRQGSAVYVDSQGNQHIGGIPTKLGYVINPYNVLPLDYQKYGENIRDRDLPEIENNTPPSPVNNPPTRRQRSREKRGGGMVKPPVGAKGGAWATLVLDVVIKIYDTMVPLAINAENDNINHHCTVLVNNVMNDIKQAIEHGIINEELTFAEYCQLINVVLYGGDDNISDKIYEMGSDVYEFVSKFEKIR